MLQNNKTFYTALNRFVSYEDVNHGLANVLLHAMVRNVSTGIWDHDCKINWPDEDIASN